MKYQVFSLRALSLLVTMSCVPLLLADSAEPYCASFSFHRRFDVTTTCGGNQSGRVGISATASPPMSQHTITGAFSLSNVQLPVKTVEVGGACDDEDEPFKVTKVFLTFGLSAGSGGTGGSGGATGTTGATGTGGSGGGAAMNDATCEVNLKTDLDKDLTCTAPSGETCTVHVETAP